MQNTLVPVNFSPASKVSIPFAARIAKESGAKVTLLTSGASPLTEDNLAQTLGHDLPSDFEARKRVLEAALKSLTEPYQNDYYLEKDEKVTFEALVKEGVMMRDIVEESETGNYDLIVMGTHGVQIPAEEVWGTYTANLINEVNTPMLIVPLNGDPKEISTIVYASALEGSEREDIEKIKPFADIFNADMTCLHITTRNNEEVKERMLNLEANYFFTPISELRFELMEGDSVAAELKSYLEDRGAAMLAIRPKHRNFIESIFDASISRKLALHTKNPILILR